MKCEICGTELRAEPAITEPGWIIFHECVVTGKTEQEVIDKYEKIRASAHNSEYMQCEYCHGTKILCSGAGQCDHDGKECNANHNCSEYTPAPCKFCMK